MGPGEVVLLRMGRWVGGGCDAVKRHGSTSRHRPLQDTRLRLGDWNENVWKGALAFALAQRGRLLGTTWLAFEGKRRRRLLLVDLHHRHRMLLMLVVLVVVGISGQAVVIVVVRCGQLAIALLRGQLLVDMPCRGSHIVGAVI